MTSTPVSMPGSGGTCTPISWLRLERYHLGELPSDAVKVIAAHLASCERCRSCLDRIQNEAPDELPALPAKPAMRPRRTWFLQWRALGFATSALALALFVLLRPAGHEWRPARVFHAKGGDVALDLVREREGSVAMAPTSFAEQDRFKAFVTCPPPMRLFADLVVFQEHQPSFPGQPEVIVCGNRVPYPQAFRITGHSPATVCVVVDGSRPPSRERLASAKPDDLGATGACLSVDPARE